MNSRREEDHTRRAVYFPLPHNLGRQSTIMRTYINQEANRDSQIQIRTGSHKSLNFENNMKARHRTQVTTFHKMKHNRENERKFQIKFNSYLQRDLRKYHNIKIKAGGN